MNKKTLKKLWRLNGKSSQWPIERNATAGWDDGYFTVDEVKAIRKRLKKLIRQVEASNASL